MYINNSDDAQQNAAEVTFIHARMGWASHYSKPNQYSDVKRYGYWSDDVKQFPAFAKPEDRANQHFEFTVFGSNLPEIRELTVTLYGRWNDHPKGPTFYCDYYEIELPSSKSAAKKLLMSNKFPGVGKTTATKVIDTFGADVFKILKNDPNRISEVPGLNEKQVQKIISGLHHLQADSIQFLIELGLKITQCTKVMKYFKDENIDVNSAVQANPFVMIECPGIGFGTCEVAARYLRAKGQLQMSMQAPERIMAAIIHTLQMNTQSLNDSVSHGDVCMPKYYLESKKKPGVYEESCYLLNSGAEITDADKVSKEQWEAVFQTMIGDKFIRVLNLIGTDNKIVYLMENYFCECSIAKHLIEHLTREVHQSYLEPCTAALEDYCDKSQIQLESTQKQAVMRSLMNKVSVITGGPGTGKTTIIAAIIAVYEEVFGQDVLLMAPTGKAARRMEESTKHPASTIHSRLGIDPNTNTISTPIHEMLTIIDESSMIDAELMRIVMESFRFGEAQRVVFVGDIDQLPSVGPGAVLKNMIESDVIPTTRLTKIFRQSGDQEGIIRNARRIKEGEPELIHDGKSFFIKEVSEGDLTVKLSNLYERAVKKYGRDGVALLCPRRRNKDGKIPSSSEGMNVILQSVVNPASGTKADVKIDGVTYRVGDRVMKCVNDETGNNGDIGEITAIFERKVAGSETGETEVGIEVEWENGIGTNDNIATFKAANVVLAYAMSVHKSQGSEYPCVIVPMISSYGNVSLQRNLLYTAITRAKECVVLVGEEEAVRRAILNVSSEYRLSMLNPFIRRYAKEAGIVPGAWKEQVLEYAPEPVQQPEPPAFQQLAFI